MTTCVWRPLDEAEATATPAAFLEFVRATRPDGPATPEELRDWSRRDEHAFEDAIADFAGLDPSWGVRANLLRHTGAREAFVQCVDGIRQAWSRDALRLGPLPPPVQAALDAMDWTVFVRHLADHILVADTRPDDSLVWTGAPSDPWPYAALAIGATVVLSGEIAPQTATISSG